jgi:hypothetical protein
MATFDTLSQAQQDAFQQRVEMLGFNLNALPKAPIVTAEGGLRFSGAAAEFAPHVKYKTVSSVDEVKRLVGMPDSAFDKGTQDHHLRYLAPPPFAASREVTYLALSPPERGDLEAAAYAYVFGDSRKVAGWRDAIDRLLLPRELSFVAALDVVVTPQKPLYIVNPSYTFGTVTIEPGGAIIVQADSSVNVQLLVKVA